MRGTHEGTMVFYDDGAEVTDVFPPRGRAFASSQSHWFRMADGLVLEHWANRDRPRDGQAGRVGPPDPAVPRRDEAGPAPRGPRRGVPAVRRSDRLSSPRPGRVRRTRGAGGLPTGPR